MLLAGPVSATLDLPDQLDVGGGGLGSVVASFEAITNEIGLVVDDTFSGEITFKWTMRWVDFPGENATTSWAVFQFFNADNEELSCVGNHRGSSQVSTFNEGGVGLFRRSHASGIEVEKGREHSFTLVIDYSPDGQDTAILSGGGFVNQHLVPGDWGFHHIRARARGGSRVDFTAMSIKSGPADGTSVEQVDPRFPSEQVAIPPEVRSRSPWVRVRKLEAERARLREVISLLPRHHPIFRSSRLGYHSQFETAGSVATHSPSQIQFTWRWGPQLDSIAFVPAFSPKEPGAYAFPARFKVDVWLADTDEFETVVDWMDEDFPDPGLYPVFFAGIDRRVTQVRISIPQGVRESGMSYSALGEVYLFQQRLDGSMGPNMAAWSPDLVEATDSLSMTPLWDIEYLYDDLSGMGFSLSDETVESRDLMVVFEEGESPDEVQLLLDLGREQAIGRIDFWPAAPPSGLELPFYGFPGSLSLELSTDPDFQTAKVIELTYDAGSMPHESPLSAIAEAYRARYLRVTMGALRGSKGRPILGLGEISVSEYGIVLSAHCRVAAQGIPEEYMDQLPRLVDGCSWQRRILPQGEWIKGLAQRRPLDRRLAVVERELALAEEAWRLIQLRSGLWGGIVIFAGLVLGIVLQRRQRQRILNRLKWRIARDLHDDVGSNLGSISLVAERLRQDVKDAKAREDLADLSLLAREASVSLRDVVWVIDQTTIRLPDLVQTLAERAQRILSEAELSVDVPPDCPDVVVPLTLKRHLIMFFREVIHNCARHANATQVEISVSTEDRELSVMVSDNGCGFDPSARHAGWGLDSMLKRAQEMGGAMEVDSQAGQGTAVKLTVPLKTMLKNTDHLYKTSN